MQAKKFSHIKKASREDIDAIVRIEEKCFPKPTAYSRRQLAYLSFKANGICLVETQAGTVKGFVIVVYRRGSLKGWIETLNVDPKFQGQGVGATLLKAAEDDMRKRGKTLAQLEVSKGNAAAIGLYTNAGYIVKENLSTFYKYEHHGTRDAIRMTKKL